MSLLYAMAWLCDAMLYFAAMGCVGALGGAPEWLFVIPLLMAAGCALGFRFRDRGRRWLVPPLAAVICAMALLKGIPLRLLCLPPAVYLFLYMRENRGVTDYYYAAERFRYALVVLAGAMFLASMIQSSHWTQGLPYLFAFLSLTIFRLRMLRADDSAMRSRRFRLMNLVSICAVCAASFALSQPAVLAALGAAWRFIADNILTVAASALLYAIGWVLYAVAWLLSQLLPGEDGPLMLPEYQAMGTLEEAYLPPEQGGMVINPVARALLIAVGCALLASIVLLILRALARQMARAGGSEAEDERESLVREDNAPPAPRLRPRSGDTGEGVRYYYLRQLRFMKARGGSVLPNMNTRQLRDANAGGFDPEALDELRSLYLPVRYDGRAAGPGEVRHAREAWERLRGNGGRHG